MDTSSTIKCVYNHRGCTVRRVSAMTVIRHGYYSSRSPIFSGAPAVYAEMRDISREHMDREGTPISLSITSQHIIRKLDQHYYGGCRRGRAIKLILWYLLQRFGMSSCNCSYKRVCAFMGTGTDQQSTMSEYTCLGQPGGGARHWGFCSRATTSLLLRSWNGFFPTDQIS